MRTSTRIWWAATAVMVLAPASVRAEADTAPRDEEAPPEAVELETAPTEPTVGAPQEGATPREPVLDAPRPEASDEAVTEGASGAEAVAPDGSIHAEAIGAVGQTAAAVGVDAGVDPEAETGGDPETDVAAEAETDVAAEAVPEGDDPDAEADSEAADAGEDCLPPPVTLRRIGPDKERAELRLTDCDGRPTARAIETVSRLARAKSKRGTADDAKPRRLDAGLVARLQHLASAWPGREIEIISGHRPRARRGSRHRGGYALDVRIEGVDNEELVERLRELPQSGVGFYPNSSFVHIDVRPSSAYWVDRSGPGEPADYGPWPARDAEQSDDDIEALRAEALAAIERALEAHGPELPLTDGPDEEPDPLEAADVAAVLDAPEAAREPSEGADALAPAEEGDELAQAAGEEAAPEPAALQADDEVIATDLAAEQTAAAPADEPTETAEESLDAPEAAQVASAEPAPVAPPADPRLNPLAGIVADAPELGLLSDRALIIMNEALGRGLALGGELPEKPEY